ncbi:phage tail tape measure protein [Clostridium cadaveris]|uniref:phage tail tape measure protein n=1 Tax=Clostridium cadaveris TaxID=1529 RepID=UPI0003FC2D97|nr:phage tail tape measure protein [Clostridium cadaveris]
MADGSIIIDTKIDSSGAEKGISELSRKAQDGLGTMNKAFLATSAAIGGIGAYAIKVGGDFEEGMSKVQAISGSTAKEIEQLSIKAKDMGAKTKFSATESAEAMQYMAMAGWKTSDMLNGIDGIMNLAAASGEDLALVSDIVTDALTAFGMSAKDSAQFADLLASAASNSNTNVSMLGESFKYVAPVAGALKMSAKDTAFALGLMANSGIKASQSGTALRASLTNLAHPSKEMAKEMDRLGISLVDTNRKVKEGKELYDELRQKFSGLSDAQKTQSAATIFGKEAMSGMLAIINASEEDYDKLYDSLNNSEGAAENMANTMNDNLKGSLVLLGSAVEGAGIAFYEKFSGPAKDAVDNVAAWFSNLTVKLGNGELDNTLSGIATALVGVGTALLVFNVVTIVSDFIAVMKGAAAATKLVASAQKILNAIMAMSTMGWIVIGISAVIAALVTLWNTNEDFRNAVINAWEKIKEVASNVWGAVCDFFTETIPEAFNSVKTFFTEDVPNWFNEQCEKVKQFFIDGWNSIVAFFTETIPLWIENIVNWFSELPYKIGYALGELLGTIIQGWVNIFNYFGENIPIWIDNIVNWFSELPGRIYDWLVSTLDRVKNWAIEMHNKSQEIGKQFLDAIIEWFSTLPSRISQWFSRTIDKVIQWGSDMYDKASTAARETAESIVDWFKELPGNMLDIGKNIVQGIWNGIKNAKDWLWDKITGFCSGIMDGFKNALGIHSPSRLMRDIIGKNLVKGISVGIDTEMPDLDKQINSNINELAAKLKGTVDYETAKTSAIVAGSRINNTTSTVTNNDNGITQNVTIVNPERTPSENARALKKAGRDLVFG